VDVLPTLRTSASIADHVRQYFREDTPGPVRLSSRIADRRAFRPALSRIVRQGVLSMADRFIGGATAADALPKLRKLAERGTASTIDLLGEATLSAVEADAFQQRYIDLIVELAAGAREWDAPPAVAKPNISIKLSALSAHFEYAAPDATSREVCARLLPILL